MTNKTLDELIESVSKTHKFNKDKLIFLNTSDVLDGKILSYNYSNTSDLKGQAKKTIKYDDILFSEIRPKNKRFAYVNIKETEDFVVSTKLMVLRNKTKNVLTKYIYYFLTYEGTLDYLQMRAENRIGSFPQITFDILKPISVNIPDVEDQKKIVNIISALDDKIELNNRINAELEAMAKTLYDYWFVQFDFPIVTSSGVEKPYKSSGGKMVYNETLKREIPEGWEVKTVGELVNIFDSKRIPLSKSEREKKKGIFPYYGATEIMDYINDFIFDGEYILLAEDGSVMNSEGFPILQYIYGKTWVNNHAHVLQSKQIEYTEYLYKLLEMIPVILIKSGSIQMKINQDNLLNYKLLVAPETLILKYSKFAKSIRQKLIQNQKQNQELSALRDWLLPMLMNGQVKVG